jgi:prepilin-type N-terminal cleavage/methylation domain-containing protein
LVVRQRQPRRAFTLFELVLALAVMVVIAAVSAPSLDSMFGSFRAQAAADSVRGAWAEARAHAMNEGRAYRFSIVPNQGNYRLAPDSPQYWAGAGGSVAPDDSANRSFVREESLPRGVRFMSSGQQAGAFDPRDTTAGGGAAGIDPGSYTNPVVFLPDGTAREDAELVLQSRGARPLVVRLRGLTGIVTTRWLPEGDRR